MSRSIFGLILFWLVSLPLRAEQPIFTISSLDANPGQIIDIDFHVDNFTDIISVQYSVNWDPTVLKFRAIKNLNPNVPGLTSGLFGTTPNLVDNGQFTLSWIESSITPITIPDASLFYTVEFEVVGSPCDQSNIAITNTPLEIEVAEGEDETPVGLVSNNGEVNVPGVGCSEDIEFIGSQVVGPCGENVCIQFAVQNFTDVGAMQFNLVYDPAVLEFNQFQNYAPLMGFGSGNTNLFAPGELRVVWFNGNIENESLPDGTVLFEICFDVIGTGGQFSNITFGSSPEISDTDGNIHPVNITPARITAQCALEGFALIVNSVTPDTACIEPGQVVCIDVKVNDFEEIIALQFSMNWDSTKFKFDRVEGFGLAGLDASGFGTPGFPDVDEGQLTISWIDLSLQGVTIPDNAIIFRLCLEAVGPVNSTSSIIFSGDPLDIEIANLDSVITSYTLVQGVAEIKANCDEGCQLGYILNTLPVTCAGDSNGVLNLSVMTPGCNCTPTYLWSTGATSQDLTGMPAGTYSVTITCENVVVATATIEEPDPANVQSNISFAGGCTGAIDLTVTGGTPPFNFQWSTPPGSQTEDISNLCAGVYTVTITDNNNCVTVAGPYVIGGNSFANVDNVSCNGVCDGAIDLSATFGTGPYTYVWNTVPVKTTEDIDGLCAGNYCVTITDSGGSTHDTCFTVTQPNVLTATATITHSDNCQGAIDLNVTGGTQSYSYIWQPGGATTQDIIGLCAGQYCVTVTDAHGCTFTNCYTVFEGGGLNVALSAVQHNGFQISCNGVCDGRITTQVAGGTPPLSYQWSNNSSEQNLLNVCAGTYSVTVTDAAGQTSTASIVLNQPPALNLNITETIPSSPGATDGAVSAVVTGGVPSYVYTWLGPVNGNTAAMNNLPGGIYNLTVIDANGCQVTGSAVLSTGDCYKGMSVFTPNSDGKNDHFIITCVSDPNHLFIFNRQGALVYETDNYQNNWIGVDQDDEPVPDGSYLWVLEAEDDNGNPAFFKGVVILLRTAD